MSSLDIIRIEGPPKQQTNQNARLQGITYYQRYIATTVRSIASTRSIYLCDVYILFNVDWKYFVAAALIQFVARLPPFFLRVAITLQHSHQDLPPL